MNSEYAAGGLGAPPLTALNRHLLSKCCLGLLSLHTTLIVGCVVFSTAAALNIAAVR
jgi:hypothetical protein